MVRTSSEEETVAMEGALGNNLPTNEKLPPLDPPQLRDKVDSVIHDWFTDLWLLSTGEELMEFSSLGSARDGQAFAMVCGGQLRLLGSRESTLSLLRSVGIEMD